MTCDPRTGSAAVLGELMRENGDLREVVASVLTLQPQQAPVILAKLFEPLRLQVRLVCIVQQLGQRTKQQNIGAYECYFPHKNFY